MKNINQFIDNVKNGVLSDYSLIEGMSEDYMGGNASVYLSLFESRNECTKRGMWAIVDKNWTKKLAKWIGNRKCLEVMAGAGWLAKALDFHEVDIIATDDYSWEKSHHKEMKVVHNVEKINGLEAVRTYGERDVLIVSWPPYGDEKICNICDEWGNNKPIIYIGEGDWGCNAPSSFWDNFKEIEDIPEIRIPRWWGINDSLRIGKWKK